MTAFGAWVNLVIVVILAVRAKYLTFERPFQLALLKFALAGLLLAAALWATATFAAPALFTGARAGRDVLTLALLVGVGAVAYVVSILALFGRRWLVSLIR